MPWPRGAVDSRPATPSLLNQSLRLKPPAGPKPPRPPPRRGRRVRVRRRRTPGPGRRRRASILLELLLRSRASPARFQYAATSGARLRQDPLAFQLAGVLLQIFLRRLGDEDDLAADEAVGAGRPAGRRAGNRECLRRDGRHVELLVRPAAVEAVGGRSTARAPTFCRPHSFILADGPFAGLLHVGRAGQPRAVDVGQPARDLHDLRGLPDSAPAA